jgi:hypothetical protein
MATNNIAEVVLRVTTEGRQNAQALANQLTHLDQTARQVATSMLSAATAQNRLTTEAVRADSQVARLTQAWGDLEQQVDHFSATALREFASTSAHVLTQWIEGSVNAREAFRRFALSVIEGIIEIAIQQTIAHALGLTQMTTAATVQTATNTAITASAAPAAATEGAATFGANAIGVALVIAAVLAGIAAMAASRAEGGPIYGAGGETEDKIPAWLSHNEYVMPAAAHRHYGTNVMEAMRTRTIDREKIRSVMEHRTMAMGGMVDGGRMMAATAAYAEGGSPRGDTRPTTPISFSPNMSFATPPVLVGDDAFKRWLGTTEGQRFLDGEFEKRSHKVARQQRRTGGQREA